MFFISKNEQDSLSQYLKTLTLLYVEDDKDIRDALIQFLKRRVKELLIAENGYEGLCLFNKYKPDLIISDVKMPVMNGLEMIQAIRETDGDIPIILTTAFRESDYFLQAIEYDVDEYLLKPIEPTLLSRILLKCSKLLKDRRYAKIARTTFESIQQAILITDSNHQIISINPKFTDVFHYSIEDIYLKDMSILNAGKQNLSFYEDIFHYISEYGFWEGEIWNRTQSGNVEVHWLTIQASSKTLNQLNYIYMFNDITIHQHENENKNSEIEYQAYHDCLTKLPNRYLLLDRLEESIAFAERYEKNIAVLFLDLNKFKPVNDTYGHHVGDILLQEIAKRLTESVHIFDTVSRLGGDEFVIILVDVPDTHSIEVMASSICENIEKPIQICNDDQKITLNVSTSIGISVYPIHGSTGEKLLRLADESMYYAKKSNISYYIYS